ncbi:MAG: hypothetical protein HKM07_05945 [Chlamydiae bacterium]|nr:hypothetical protein [Chlamydiota bacterium]
MKKPSKKSQTPAFMHFSAGKYLGDFSIVQEKFPYLDEIFEHFYTEEFVALNDRQKNEKVDRILLQLLKSEETSSFLLIPVLDYIDRINHEKILENYSFSNFELWLNQFSGISGEENYEVRSLITGKMIPREEYQTYFPIGMDKFYPGTHFVTAHSSPDLDTTVASFWGWIDAFAARVSTGLHIWNLPGGEPPSQVEIPFLFQQIFGENVFSYLAKSRTTLSLSSIDLMTQKGVIRKQTDESSLNIDHERNQNAIVLIDKRGYYLGDWRNFDVEGVRQIIMLLNNCLRWFENNLHVKLISLFAKEKLSNQDFVEFIREIFGIRIRECEPAKDFTEKQNNLVQDYLCKVLGVPKGLDSTFDEFARAMEGLFIFDFQELITLIESLPGSSLFDNSGILKENRPKIFHQLEKIIKGMDKAIQSVRSYVERLDVALDIKTQVFGYLPQVVSYRADLEEIRSKMGTYPYLTVTYPDKQGRLLPIGVIQATDLYKTTLGTVTLRDFSNREETKIPSYLDIISIIDHHKSTVTTTSPATVLISDAQSSNVLLAELAFSINDKYSTGGMSLEEIAKQVEEVQKDLSTPSKKRIFQRLLQRQILVEKKTVYYIDPKREFVEYLHFLYAIFDDTDLLTKVSYRDCECVRSLLNRMKSLSLGKEMEIISFDDLHGKENFVQRAAKRILQNADVYSLYRKIYIFKENSVEENLELCAKGKPSKIFIDTKVQNGCCRVGQTKMFSKNFASYNKYAPAIRKIWVEEALDFYKDRNEVDLYLHMITTIAGAEDLFSDSIGEYPHRDEIWIWIPSTIPAIEHLKSFLNAFKAAPEIVSNQLEVEFLGDNAQELDQIFNESFQPIPRKKTDKKVENLPIAILRFTAGTINSRKAMISPYLPKMIS